MASVALTCAVYVGGLQGVDTCDTIWYTMTDQTYTPVIAFDPGASTGVAVLDEFGEILLTETFTIQELDSFMSFMLWISRVHFEVVVEQGPEYGHHSPVTRRAEELILDVFSSAHRVLPGHWKSHPHYRKRVHIPKRLVTAHEHDAVRLAQWFQETGASNASVADPTRSNNSRSRHKRK